MEDTTSAEQFDCTLQDLIADLGKGGTSSGEGFNSAAIARLAAIGSAAIDPLIEATQAGAPWARANAAMALAAIGDGRASVVEALSQAWLDPNKIVSGIGRMALLRLPHPTDATLLRQVNKEVEEKLREIMQQRRRDAPEA